ncbi:Thioredoxin-like, putative [Angomonas deanei]|uniref:protein-disulfide reductase n=1 Tax=Angomonas deanei TaxID=59799 RepID=A0A7G2C3F8_9TRYP|nr:Thioredoxin-like, putative [Angomonas deanei]
MYQSIKKVMLQRVGRPSKMACLFFSPDTPAAPSTPEYLLVYFTASWCPSSREFTGVLNDFYTKHGASKRFDVLVLSNDEDEVQYTTELLPTLHKDFLLMEHFRDVLLQTPLIAKDYGAQCTPLVYVFRVDSNANFVKEEAKRGRTLSSRDKNQKPFFDSVIEEERADVENRLYYVTRYGRDFIYRELDTAETFPWWYGDEIIETERRNRKKMVWIGVSTVVLVYVLFYCLFGS